MTRSERACLVDTADAPQRELGRCCSRRFAMVLWIVLGSSALGCFTLAYRIPPSDTPTAVVRPMQYAWFDVFHADEGCPGASTMIWNSEYLGTIDVRRPNQSFEIPANGYVRLAYRAIKSIPGSPSEIHFRGEFVIKPSPGSEYIIKASDLGTGRWRYGREETARSIQIYAEEGDLVMVTCDDGVPVTVTPVKNRTNEKPPTP